MPGRPRTAGLKKVPLDGFMGEADWNGVGLEMPTRVGVFRPIPVTLSASDELATRDGIHLTVTGGPT